MDETPKEKLNWRRLLSTIGIVLVAAALVGGGVWYYMNQSATSLAGSTKKTESALQKQIQELKKENTKPSATECPEATPVVAFEPAGLFTDAEKTDIANKVTNAYLYYNNETELKVVSLLIHKYQESDRPSGYMYSGTAIFKNSGTEGWLFGKTGEALEYWKPTCMDECVFTDSFRERYPNNL